MDRAPTRAATHAAAATPSAGVTATARPLIQRHAAASIARKGPSGMAWRAAARARAVPLNEASHCVTAPYDVAATMRSAPQIHAAATCGVRPASRRCAPAAAIADPNGKNAASEWKYEPRVEWSVQTSDCARYTTRASTAHALTSA